MMVEHLHLAVPVRIALTEVALCAWVGQAYPGEQLVYHGGFLAIDTGPDSRVLTPVARQELRRMAGRAYQLFEQGLVHLRHVVYFVAVTYFSLFAATRVLEARRWR